MHESEADARLRHHLTNQKDFSCDWVQQEIGDEFIQPVLDGASKNQTGKIGRPDFIYVNKAKRLLILIENKKSVNDHNSDGSNNPIKYAVHGAKHYLSHFKSTELDNKHSTIIQNYLHDWKFIGIACSGDITNKYGHRIDTFVIDNNEIVDIAENEILNESEYLARFENIDYEKISSEISKASERINNWLRSLDSQKRPVLLSGLMICLYPDDETEGFRSQYATWTTTNIIRRVKDTIDDVLKNQGVPQDKIKILKNELAFLDTDHDLNNTNILTMILKELDENVLPLFSLESSYDIIGRFYEEFLRYAGVTNVKNGIVLTPNHIRELFVDLIDIKWNDVILDPACGTGGLLISAMRKLESIIKNSELTEKKEKLAHINKYQIIGIEKNSTMYSLAISNMMFRGDGKSNIYNDDFFSEEVDKVLTELEKPPTIGVINPPYGGKDNKSNPTKKEIQFLEKMLDCVSRFGIIIAPLSCYLQDDTVRNRILQKHTLKYVVNMPVDLFYPNASTVTAVAVFETHKPHDSAEVVFYNLEDDGLVMSKRVGRTDLLNKWSEKKSEMLEAVTSPLPSSNLIQKTITKNDEWLFQSHSKPDYNTLDKNNFCLTVKEYAIFLAKQRLGLIDKDLDEVMLLELFQSDALNTDAINEQEVNLNAREHKDFLAVTNEEEFGLFNIRGTLNKKIASDIYAGEYLYVTTSNKNNGVKSSSHIYAEEPNVITVDSATDGKAFYQNFRFIGSDHVEVLEPNGFELNTYIGLYLTTMLNFYGSVYGYGRKRAQKRLAKEKLRLPVDDNGDIDWVFMEDFIKSIPYSSNLE